MTNNLTTDFFENEDHALRHPNIVLRDSLGILAVQLLSKQEDITKLDYSELLSKLHKIITELHTVYHKKHGNFS